MAKICYAAQVRAMDKAAEEVGGIPSIILMENAALGCVDVLREDFGDLKNKRICIFAGKGNNGGDGLAAARHLHNMGAEVHVLLTGGREYKGDALINYEIVRKMGISMEEITDVSLLDYIIPSMDIVIDAIYGTGIRGTVTGSAYDVIDKINKFGRYILSVDIPSGINADSGEICGICVRAHKTVTFAAYKMAMALFPGCDFMGEIILKDISMPEYIRENPEIQTEIIDGDFVRECIPKRNADSQKGDYGKVLIIAGSKGMTGAAYMAAESALRAGAGLVTLGIAESLNPIMEEKLTEVMTLPLADDGNGNVSPEAFDVIKEKMKGFDVLLFGPGLGRTDGITELAENIIKSSEIPVIMDADGLNAIAGNIGILEECRCSLTVTPHEVEMSRLCGMSLEYVRKNRFEVGREFAKEYGATVVLKGNHTIVTSPDECQYVNMTGNAGMAVGGSGDVLAGIIAALTARGINESYAAAAGVYIHAAAGDKCMEKYGMDGVTPVRMMENIRI